MEYKNPVGDIGKDYGSHPGGRHGQAAVDAEAAAHAAVLHGEADVGDIAAKDGLLHLDALEVADKIGRAHV